MIDPCGVLVERMCLRARFRAVALLAMKVLLAGMFGAGNFGDELFARVVAEQMILDNRFDTPIVLTSSKEVTRRNVPGAIPLSASALVAQRRNFANLVRVIRDMDHVLIGGGALFGEAFLRTSVVGTSVVAAIAYALGKPYTLHGIGIDRISMRANTKMLRWCLRNAESVVCRSEVDYRSALAAGCRNPILGVDINHYWLRDYMRSRHDGMRFFTVNLQHALARKDDRIASLLDSLRENGQSIQWVFPNRGC